jgi:hypothetical protein
MAFLSSEKENKSYIAGSYNKIKTFDEIGSDFYSIDNIAATKYSSGSVNFKSWNSIQDAYVFNTQWVVFYGYTGKHYEIVENSGLFKKRLLIYSLIGSVFVLLIYLFLRHRKRIAIQAV